VKKLRDKKKELEKDKSEERNPIPCPKAVDPFHEAKESGSSNGHGEKTVQNDGGSSYLIVEREKKKSFRGEVPERKGSKRSGSFLWSGRSSLHGPGIKIRGWREKEWVVVCRANQGGGKRGGGDRKKARIVVDIS